MPYIDIRVSKHVDTQTRERLQIEIANKMELISGKTASNTLIFISDNYATGILIEAAFVDIRLFKESPAESKRNFAESLFRIFSDVLNVIVQREDLGGGKETFFAGKKLPSLPFKNPG